MAITYNSQEAKSEKKPTIFQGFTYDTETDSGCINKFEIINSLIVDVSNDVEDLSSKYNTLQSKYDKFTDFNEQMNSNKNSLRTSVDNIRTGFIDITKNLNSQVEALQANDSSLITDLESINKLMATQTEQGNAINESRKKTDSSTPSGSSSSKSDEEINKVVDDVINGKYGSGDERKEALRKAGYDPDDIQKRVNDKMSGGGTTPSTGDTTPTENPSEKSGNGQTTPTDRPDAPKDTDNPSAGFTQGTSGIPSRDEKGLIVRQQSDAAQAVINKLYYDIDSTKPAGVSVRAQGKHSAELDSMIDNLSPEECAWVMSRIENDVYGQSDRHGSRTAETDAHFIDNQLNRRFGGDIHNLLKSWGTYDYGGY